MNGKTRKHNSKRTTYIVMAVVAVIAIIGVVFALLKTSGSKRYDDYFHDGKEYYEAGDYDSAITYLEKAVKIKATDSAVTMLADCYVAEGDRDKALELLKKYSHSSAVKKKLEELQGTLDEDGIIEIDGETFDADAASIGLSDRDLTSTDIGDMAKFTALESANLSQNKITDINVLKNLTTLKTLDLSDNDITDVSALSGLTALRTLYLDDNDITDFTPLYNLKKLTTLSIKGMDITESKLKEIQDALPDCRVHSEKASVDVVDITLGGVKFKSDVTELDLSGKGISNISELSKCENLRRLDLRNNSIADLSPLMDLPDLEWLCIKGNRISDLRPLMGLTRLTYLDAQNNKVASISTVGALSDLTNLYLGGNTPAGFSPLTDLVNLKELGLESTGLKDGDLKYLRNLKSLSKLYIENNPGLTATAVNELQGQLKGCKISHSELISDIALGSGKFSPDAETVNAANMDVSDLSPVTGFKKCHTLLLGSNKIASLTPLFSMTGVRTLDLSNNKITDVTALIGMTGLQSLSLEGNSLSDVTPLMSMSWLKELYISSGSLTEDQINSLYAALPGCEITVDGVTQ